MGPQTFECTNSKVPLDLCSLCGKVFLMFSPNAQPLQWLCFSTCSWGTPLTACLKCLSAPWCKCAILLCHKSPWLLLLLTRAFADSKCSLYTFSVRIPITQSKLLFDPLGLMYTLWSQNFTWNPLSSKVETDMRFLVNPGTCNTSAKPRGLSDSLWNQTMPIPCAWYCASSPTSMWRFNPPSYQHLKNLFGLVIWKDAPLSTYQPLLPVVLSMQAIKQKSVSKLLLNSSTSAKPTICVLFFFFMSGH